LPKRPNCFQPSIASSMALIALTCYIYCSRPNPNSLLFPHTLGTPPPSSANPLLSPPNPHRRHPFSQRHLEKSSRSRPATLPRRPLRRPVRLLCLPRSVAPWKGVPPHRPRHPLLPPCSPPTRHGSAAPSMTLGCTF
jgi:hypothetical protein